MTILIASNNAHKIKEIRQILIPFLNASDTIVCPSEYLPHVTDTPVENGSSFEENAAIKALYYSRLTNALCIADDSGLEVYALEYMPGIYSARFSEEGTDTANNIKLLKELTGVSDRSARFVCVCAAARGGELLTTVRGECPGFINESPRGEGGFGYDPLFVPDGYNLTYSEMKADIKNSISHRCRAFRAMAQWIGQYSYDRRDTHSH